MDKVELKPCPNPWCGDHIFCAYHRPPLWRIKCACGVQGPTAYTEAEAIAAWNTRPDTTTIEALQAQVAARDAEIAVEREAQFQWDAARWKLRMAPSQLPKSRSDFRTIARAALGQGRAERMARKKVPYAYCCAEAGGNPAACDCVNKNHGTAYIDVPSGKAVCSIPNCRNIAPADQAFCSEHRS